MGTSIASVTDAYEQNSVFLRILNPDWFVSVCAPAKTVAFQPKKQVGPTAYLCDADCHFRPIFYFFFFFLTEEQERRLVSERISRARYKGYISNPNVPFQ